jgi:hypothetical protein
MTVLNIAGKRVTVDDSFESLTPDQQNSTVEEISRQLGASSPPDQSQPSQQPASSAGSEPGAAGTLDAFGRGITNAVTAGFADEIGAAADYAGSHILPWRDPKTFDQALSDTRGSDNAVAAEHPVANIAGNVTGAVGMGAGLARAGLSPTANAIARGAGLGGVAAASAGEGAALGAINGFGSGQDGFLNRLAGAGVGGGAGLAIGAAAPYVVAGGGSFLQSLAAPVLSRLNPEPAANRAIGAALQRSGKTPGQIADMLQFAADDGQDGYAVADALGHSGQRMLSSVARTPNGARQEVVDQLLSRQMGQGDRLSNALAEGFSAPDTAAQRTTALTAARTADANRNYGAARQAAGAVNVSPILDTIDQTLSPGVNRIASPRDNIGYDTIEGALARVRGMLSDGNSQVTDFNTLFRAKLDLDDMIQRAEGQGAGNRAFALGQVQRQVDRALAAASPEYRNANDTFARQSGVIDAVDAGRAATSGRTRAGDNIASFNGMTPDQQGAFRAGYADPLISRIESASAAPTTNKARMLNTPKFQQEFPAFAAPGQADQLGRRVGREQRMFETVNQAIGGSRTADNLADMDEIRNFDPAVLTNLFKGNWKTAALQAVTKVLNEGKGMPPAVIERVGRSLMETDPVSAGRLLTVANSKAMSDTAKRGMATVILNNLAAPAPGRLVGGPQ